jgi:hypothetical protein
MLLQSILFSNQPYQVSPVPGLLLETPDQQALPVLD